MKTSRMWLCYGHRNEYCNSALDTSGMFSSLAFFGLTGCLLHPQAADVKRKKETKEKKMYSSDRLCSLIAEIRWEFLK